MIVYKEADRSISLSQIGTPTRSVQFIQLV